MGGLFLINQAGAAPLIDHLSGIRLILSVAVLVYIVGLFWC